MGTSRGTMWVVGRSVVSVGRPGGRYATKADRKQARKASQRPMPPTPFAGLTREQREANRLAAEVRQP